jgi:hypothetical protein
VSIFFRDPRVAAIKPAPSIGSVLSESVGNRHGECHSPRPALATLCRWGLCRRSTWLVPKRIRPARTVWDRMPFATNAGVRVHWQEQGAGTPLLLIMGHRFSGEIWWPVLPVTLRHRVVCFDNRGTGESDSPATASVVEMVGDALAVMNAAGVEKAHVFGVSMGGGIAQQLKASYSVPGCPPTSLASNACDVYSPPMARMRRHRTASPNWLENGLIRSGSDRGRPTRVRPVEHRPVACPAGVAHKSAQ